MKWKIPLFKNYSDKKDIEGVSKIIKSGLNWATGENIELLERAIAKYVNAKYAVLFNSGTSALHAMMVIYDIKTGDEVIVPSFTFIATANSVLFTGAKPVFAEIEGETYGLDPKDVEKKITKKTKAIMPIHYGGLSCHIRELRAIAKKHNLLLLEDAAESLGARAGEKSVGAFGDAGMFSFCAPKVISTGEGGVVVTNSQDAYEKMKLFRSHGRAENANYFSSAQMMEYVTLGYNFRMSNITAALGLSQLKKIDKLIKMRQRNSAYLTNLLSPIGKIVLPLAPKNYFHIYQMYTIRLKENNPELRNRLQQRLNKKGIMAKVYYPCIHLSNFYRNAFGYKEGHLPVTEMLSNQALTLPMYPELNKKQMNYMAKEITAFFKKK